MAISPGALASTPEALVVALARTGDRDAFTELVRRRQGWVRTLMWRCCGDVTLADDLAQQAFLNAWQDIGKLRNPRGFATWLRTLAINVWRQHLRKHDLLQSTEETIDSHPAPSATQDLQMDLDRALIELEDNARLCVVLSYHEGMSHAEISVATGLPLGTVKSHIRRGTGRLQELLSAYREPSELEHST